MRGNITQKILHDVYNDLKERAETDLDFVVLTSLAAAICALGFRMNSAAVIIGAMVVSPLLYPVVFAGTATYRGDWSAVFRAAKSFAIGLSCAISMSIAVGAFQATRFQSEIFERLLGATADYFLVAFFSGLAGTYAFYSPKMHSVVAGIAVSVALMPPVVMLGIGLGLQMATQNISLILGSGKIVLANIGGIYLGSIFMVAVLHRISRDRARNRVRDSA